MAYSSIVKPSVYFNTKLYTGNGSTQNITGVGFQPDWIWQKERSGTSYNVATDAVRGNTKQLFPNVAAAEATDSNYITSFDSDGFGQGQNNDTNESGQTYVAWNWKANGAGSSNTDGDINSTVSANTTSGLSIVKYTGNGSNDQTVGHGLGARPTAWFIKRLNADDWVVYHQGLGATQSADWYDDTYMYLNSSDAKMGSLNTGTGNPTSSVFYIGDTARTGLNGDDYIAYVFAQKNGFSKFGNYRGNGNANGTFVYTGFKPAWLMMKRSDGVNSWYIFDNKRNVFNVTNSRLKADDSVAESSNLNTVDFLSNGFKLRDNNDAWNYAGGTYIYMAFAENPLVANSGTDGVPATAK